MASRGRKPNVAVIGGSPCSGLPKGFERSNLMAEMDLGSQSGPYRRAEPETRSAGIKRWLGFGEAAPTEERRGEIILVSARWVLIVIGLLLTLNAPANLVNLQVSIGGILALAAVNFVLHTNLAMKRSA